MTGRLGLLACLAVAAVLRFVVLGRADLWSDEVHTLHAVALPWGEMCAERFRAGHVPLWFLIEKAWVGIAGDSQFAIRASSAWFGTLALVPAWSFFHRMLAPRRALAATALVAVHPLLVELSREARMYSFALLLLFVLLDGAASALASGRVPRRVWIASALGCATHPSFAFAVVAVVVWLAWERRARREPSPVLARAQLAVASGLVVLLAALPFVEPQHQELTRRAWHAEAAMFVGRTFVGSGFTWALWTRWVAAGLGAVWLVWMIVALARSDGSPARRLGWSLGVTVLGASLGVGLLGAVPWGPARYVQAASVGWILVVLTIRTSSRRSDDNGPAEAGTPDSLFRSPAVPLEAAAGVPASAGPLSMRPSRIRPPRSASSVHRGGAGGSSPASGVPASAGPLPHHPPTPLRDLRTAASAVFGRRMGLGFLVAGLAALSAASWLQAPGWSLVAQVIREGRGSRGLLNDGYSFLMSSLSMSSLSSLGPGTLTDLSLDRPTAVDAGSATVLSYYLGRDVPHGRNVAEAVWFRLRYPRGRHGPPVTFTVTLPPSNPPETSPR